MSEGMTARELKTMRNRQVTWYGLLALAQTLTQTVSAGAWPTPVGAGSAVVNASYLQAEQVSDAQGRKRDFALKEFAISGYGSYGLFKWASIGAAMAPHKIVFAKGQTEIGATDLEAWIDPHLYSHKAWHFALRLKGVFPIGLENSSWVPDYLYAMHSQGVLGFEAMPLFAWSRGSLWIQGGAGARIRGGGLVGQGRYQFDLGSRLFATTWALWRLGLSGIVPLDTRSNGKPSDQERYFGQQLAFEAKLPRRLKLGLQFDSMVNAGQEMPLGLRSNAYLGWSWL
jgi:hypothetical protein